MRGAFTHFPGGSQRTRCCPIMKTPAGTHKRVGVAAFPLFRYFRGLFSQASKPSASLDSPLLSTSHHVLGIDDHSIGTFAGVVHDWTRVHHQRWPIPSTSHHFIGNDHDTIAKFGGTDRHRTRAHHITRPGTRQAILWSAPTTTPSSGNPTADTSASLC